MALLVADLLDACVVAWERIEWQNSRPGDGITLVCPNECESAALKLARAVLAAVPSETPEANHDA